MSIKDNPDFFIECLAYYGDAECADVAVLHETFSFPQSFNPLMLSHEDMMGRYRFMLEELNEFQEALDEGDLAKMFDALLDLTYVAKGTAVQLGLPWSRGWEAVHHANMDKKRSPEKTDRGYDLVKPPGWEAPDIEKVLKEVGYEATDNS